jgi:tartrate dehydratase beta subunit/fumarate hydratase class I family protein
VKDFPVIVAIDSEGNDLYKLGRKMYLESIWI